MNDWIIANINNPDFTISDFQNIADLNSENTKLLNYQDYLQKDIVVNNDLFKDNKGNFSEESFRNYYINKAQEFQQLDEYDYLDSPEYSIWDVRRSRDSKVKNPDLQFVTVYNPDRAAMGIAGINVMSDPTKTVSELAQTQKIWDPEQGKFLDYSPNDHALFKEGNFFKNIFNYAKELVSEPLVLAKYEQDGIYIEGGREVFRKKGQYKLNDDGTYYAEKLNGRSVVGKEFISALDTITVDGSDINKYDFFDADGLDKHSVGTTVKNLVAAAPLYFLGPTGAAIYGGIFVAKELAKALPMLADVVTLFGEDQDSQLLNTMAAYGHKFTGSTSQYAKQNMFSYENFANLATDVALQWGQQKSIVNTFQKLIGANKNKLNAAYAKAAKTYSDEAGNMLRKGISGELPLSEVQSYIGTPINRFKDISKLLKSGEWEKTPLGAAALKKFIPKAEEAIAKKTRLGQDLSLAYMAIVSNTDVYDSVIQHGGTQKEAAAMALGSMIGMYGVDKYLGLGEMFFDDMSAQRMYRQVTKKGADNLMTQIGGKTVAEGTKEGTKHLTKLIREGIDLGKNTVNKYFEAVKNKSLGFVGKSIGEGLEEVSEELVADVSKSIGELAGTFGIASQTDYGAWDNPLERYTMSFLGGAMGGAMFYGINGSSNRQTQEEIDYYIRNGKTKEILKELDDLHKKGKLASTKLSWKTSEGGVYVSADSENESQNDYVYKRMKEAILQMDNIINENKLNLNEDQLFDKLVLSEARYLKLRDRLQDVSYITGYQQEFQNMIKDLKNVEDKINKLNDETNDLDRKNSSYTHALEELEAERAQIIDKRNKFLNGEYSAHYLKKMLFAIDTNLSAPFISLTFNQWVRHNYGKDAKYLTESEHATFKEKYDAYVKNSEKKSLSEAFRIYEAMEEDLIPIVEKINEDDVITWGQISDKLLKESPLNNLLTWDDKLEGESDDDYKDRNTKLEEEDDATFNLRRTLRAEEIEKHNNENLQKWYETFIQGQGIIDQGTYRKLLGSLSHRKKDLYNAHKSNIYTLPLTAGEFDLTKNTKLSKEIHEILERANENNIDEIKEEIKQKVDDTIREEVLKLHQESRRIAQAAYEFKEGGIEEDSEGNDVIFNSIEGPLTKQHIFEYFDNLLKIYKKDTENVKEIKEFLLNSPNEFITENSFDDVAGDNKEKWIDEYLLYAFPPVKELQDIELSLAMGTISEETAEELKRGLTVDTSEQLEMTDEEFDAQVNEFQKSIGEDYVNAVEEHVLKPLQQDPWIKTINEFEQKLKTDANPIIQLLKYTNPILGKTKGLEHQLEEIQKQWDELDSPVDFELSTPQIEALKDAAQQLNYIKAFIYSASSTPSFVSPVGHNRALNEFAKKYSDKVQDWVVLPELSTDVSNVYMSEIDKYLSEADFWVTKAYQNAVNKKEEFKQTDQALLKTRIDFYKNNDFTLSDGTNLLEGWDADDYSLDSLVSVDDIIYNNFQKAVKAGKKEEDILGELFEKITKIDNIVQQITTPVNRELSYAKYSDYDKFVQLVATLATRDSDFYKKVKNFINSNQTTKDGNKIASLSVQEYAERIIEASLKNPEFINKALEVVNSKSQVKLPIVKNTVLLTGVGGAGKTDVVTRTSISDIDPKDIWISGPTETQISGLSEVIKGAKEISISDLITEIIGQEQYNKLSAELEKDNPKLDYFNKRSGTDTNNERVFDLLPKKITFLKPKKLPKAIVIDEATHISGMVLQLLGQWANDNNVNVLLIGDENQKGFEGPGLNVDREKVLIWRTPRLGISLRDANYQKVKNLQQTLNILEDLRTSLNLSQEKLDDIYSKQIPNIEFKYYLDNEKFSGELITKEITPELINILKEKGKVGYVGQEDSVYKQLKDQGVNVQLFPPNKIQGREFDYVVINKDWNELKPDDNGLNAYRFLQDLYTMMSRSKEGTIFIDNGLSNIIKNKEESIYARVTSIREAAEEFNSYKLAELDALKFEEKTEEEPEESGEEESKKKTKKLPEDLPINPIVETGEQSLQQEIRFEKSTNINFPVRVYGNIHLLGVTRTTDEKDGKPIHIWENTTESKQDIGIFLEPGKKVTDGKEKHALVSKLLDLKSVLLFGTQYHDALEIGIRQRFTKEAFDNAEYYIQVRDSDYLIGGTNLDQKKLKLNGKLITVVAKIKDAEGKEYSITLGSLANPETWKSNKNKILNAIREKLDSEPSKELQEYHDNFDMIVGNYENKIKELSTKDQEIKINKPNFTAMTELIFKDSDGNKLNNIRLENIDDDYEPWANMNPYAGVTDPHIIIDEVPGSTLKKGSVVRYVSANTLINADSLEELYWDQKQNPGNIPQVRLQVLHTEGVSFRSLFAKKYKDLYSRKMKDNVVTFPINLHYQSMQMYKSMWNFRSNLKRFNKILKAWQKQENISNEELLELIKLDAEEYQKIRKQLRESEELGEKEGLSESKYRELSENKDRLSKLWEFNDNLADSVRQFRLGYSAKNGAYLRQLTNITVDNQFYKGKNAPIGIYITPDLANYYETTLDLLFEKFLDKIVEKPFENTESYIEEFNENWFNDSTSTGVITLKLYDIQDGVESVSEQPLRIPQEERLKAIPVLMTEMAKYIQYYSQDKQTFKDIYESADNSEEDDEEKKPFRIQLGDEEINYLDIFDPDGNTIFETVDGEEKSFPGVHSFSNEKGAPQTMDFRINNLWDLMFHGSIENASKNDFTDHSWTATDAYFKNGITHEPIMFAKKGAGKEHSVAVVSSKKFFSTDTGVGFPLFYINLDEESKAKTTEGSTTIKINEEAKFVLSEENINILRKVGIRDKAINEMESIDEVISELNKKIKSEYDSFFTSELSTRIQDLPVRAELNGNNIKIVTFGEIYPQFSEYNKQEWKDGALHLYSNTHEVVIQQVLGDIIVGDPKSILLPKISTETISETIPETGNNSPEIDTTFTIKDLKDALKNQLTEFYKKNDGEYDDDSKDFIESTIESYFNGIDDTNRIGKDDIRGQLADIVNILTETTGDEKLINNINELKNLYC